MNSKAKDKGLLRKQILAKMKQLSKEEKKKIEMKLFDNLINHPLWNHAKIIGITSATEIEWNTSSIISQAWQEGKEIVIPKTNPKEKSMTFFKIDSFADLTAGYQGILEPKEAHLKQVSKEAIDLLIVPGIVFDTYGYRIGFGGGYYDRFLSDFKGRTVSLLASFQLVKRLPIEKHDIHVQYLITEKEMIKIRT